MGQQGKEIPSFTTTGVKWGFQNTNYGFKEKHMLLPIPLKELNLNSNMQKNTGW